MESQHLTVVSLDDWNDLIAASDSAWLYHLLPWLELTASVYSVENHFFLAVQDGRPLGALPLQWSCRLGHAFSAVRGPAGPFWIRGLSASSRQQVLAALTGAALQWARRSGVGIVACALPPLAGTNLETGRGVNPLVLAGWTDVSTHTRIASLAGGETDLWTSLSENARRKIKRALGAGYAVRPLAWDQALDDYYRAHEATCRRTGATPYPRAYFEGIAHHIAPLGHSVLWAAFDRAGRPAAFHNSARFRDGAAYWTGCSDTEHLASGVNYLLFWQAMLGAQQAGSRWYDVGEAFPNVTAGKLKSLTEFKSRFGGELFRLYRSELRLESDGRRSLVARAGALLRRSFARARPSSGPMNDGPSDGNPPAEIGKLDRQQRFAYATHYTPGHVRRVHIAGDDYFAKLVALRLEMVRHYYQGGTVLDLCCASGDYLFAVAQFAELAVGVDFSPDLLAVAAQRAAATGLRNVRCLLGNARSLPLATVSVGAVFSFSSLYTIPAVGQVVRECARVLQPGRVAILEFGAPCSLNTLVARAHLDQAVPLYQEPLGAIHAMLREAGFTVEQERVFQLLPLWGDRPRWLWPLLHPVWRQLLSRELRGRMLDEHVSSVWPLRNVSFRHIMICRKAR